MESGPVGFTLKHLRRYPPSIRGRSVSIWKLRWAEERPPARIPRAHVAASTSIQQMSIAPRSWPNLRGRGRTHRSILRRTVAFQARTSNSQQDSTCRVDPRDSTTGRGYLTSREEDFLVTLS
ncbi:hypothetical protein pipiens_018921 [Culex pipiens pipiens]|uniref:Uncharacterized protein n=1 Tax=Culex pipiens pipiens TaxID=38569 RepID=A0ABD1DXA9_CULPP